MMVTAVAVFCTFQAIGARQRQPSFDLAALDGRDGARLFGERIADGIAERKPLLRRPAGAATKEGCGSSVVTPRE
jgi:hypothetical protein